MNNRANATIGIAVGLAIQLGVVGSGYYQSLLVILSVLSLMYGCFFYATLKGYSGGVGILLGWMSIIGLIILACLPDKSKKSGLSEAKIESRENETTNPVLEEGTTRCIAETAAAESSSYLKTLGKSEADSLAGSLDRLIGADMRCINHRRASELFDRFLSTELDFNTAGDRGIGRMTTIIPRFGAYARQDLAKLTKEDLDKLRILMMHLMFCGYFGYIILFEDNPFNTEGISKEKLFEKWIMAAYSGDMFASDNHQNIVLAVTARACTDIAEFFKDAGKDISAEEDRTAELILWYAFVAGKLRAVEIGHWK